MNNEMQKAAFYWGDATDEQILNFMKKHEVSPGKYYTNDPHEEKRLKYASMIAKHRNLLSEQETKGSQQNKNSQQTNMPNKNSVTSVDMEDLLNQMIQNQTNTGSGSVSNPTPHMPNPNAQDPNDLDDEDEDEDDQYDQDDEPRKRKVLPQTNTTNEEKFDFIRDLAKKNGLNYKISKNDIHLLDKIAQGICDPQINHKDDTRLMTLKMFYDSPTNTHQNIKKENKLDHNGLRLYPSHFQKMTKEISDFWWKGIDINKVKKFVDDNTNGSLNETQEKKYHAAIFLLKEEGIIEVKNKPIQNQDEIYFEIIQNGSKNTLYLTPKETLKQSYISPLSISNELQQYIVSILGGQKDAQGLYHFSITTDEEDIAGQLEEFEDIDLQYYPQLSSFEIK